MTAVALRKESVDRNCPAWQGIRCLRVALRKESVDRNYNGPYSGARALRSLSARRAWIEIGNVVVTAIPHVVALRKESVDRNNIAKILSVETVTSLSARRAWIEIIWIWSAANCGLVALRKESVDRNKHLPSNKIPVCRRSPQGERG